jgi:hypothetical protein
VMAVALARKHPEKEVHLGQRGEAHGSLGHGGA